MRRRRAEGRLSSETGESTMRCKPFLMPTAEGSADITL